MSNIFYHDQLQEYQVYNYTAESKYPIGTTLYKFTVVDTKNRYLQLPWQNSSTFWIETYPLCLDVITTKDTLDIQLQFFKDNDCKISDIKTTIVKAPETRTRINKNTNGTDIILSLIKEKCDMVICNNLYKVDDNVLNNSRFINYSNRDNDAIYNFKNIKNIFIKTIDMSMDKSDKEYVLNPDMFTLDNPLFLGNLIWYGIFFELENDKNEFTMNGIFYASDFKTKMTREVNKVLIN